MANHFIKGLLLLSCFWLASSAAFGQVNLQKDSTTKTGKQRKIFVFPAVIYSPETTLAFGAVANYYFKLSHDSTIRTSFVQGLGLYSLRNQAVLAIESSIFFPGERYILKTHASISHYPDRFWGVGNDSKDQDLEPYSIGQFYIYPQLLRKVYRNFFAGIAYEVQNVFTFEYGEGKPVGTSIFDLQNVAGRKGSVVSGVGLVAQWDGRDNAFSSSKGFYFSYTFSDFSPNLGSSYAYTNHFVDIRKYFTVGRNQVLAFQSILNFNNGENVPIRSLANIGSSSMLRGYYDGRYADRNLFGVQAEYRFHLTGRFGMVLFSAIGRVGFDASQALSFKQMKPSFGTGLRIAIDKKEKLNVRFDFGIGQNSNGFYFNVIEAF